MNREDARPLTALIKEARKILLFTGAGISTGSGIPDFRGPGGVWTRRKPVYYHDFMTSETARLEHWDYKLEAWNDFRDAHPNAVHTACADLEKTEKLLKLVTQNIDGLHQKAGISRALLVELHGTNAELECQTCLRRFEPDPFYEAFSKTRKPPLCECGGFLKPATISFGQNLRPEDLEEAEEAARHCDLVIALGSSLSVYPAASLPLTAVQGNVPYVIINRGPTDHDGLPGVTLRLEGDVLDIFPQAVAEALEEDT